MSPIYADFRFFSVKSADKKRSYPKESQPALDSHPRAHVDRF